MKIRLFCTSQNQSSTCLVTLQTLLPLVPLFACLEQCRLTRLQTSSYIVVPQLLSKAEFSNGRQQKELAERKQRALQVIDYTNKVGHIHLCQMVNEITTILQSRSRTSIWSNTRLTLMIICCIFILRCIKKTNMEINLIQFDRKKTHWA